MIKRLLLAALLVACCTRGTAVAEPGEIAFNRDIRPILSDNCFFCHGPDPNERQAGLRLDVRSAALSELESGAAAIVPGKPAESELVRRITSDDEFEQMPPPEHVKRLTKKQIELLTAWVKQGAEYEEHWSYTPLIRPELPELASPPAPIRNPVDLFVQSRLKKEGLVPSAEADRRTLIRRVTLDLHGLPPTLDEIEAFLADSSPDAYEKVVDRLLVSPRFAERQAMFWLDAVRYADTVGFHGDQFVSVWPYRDYVLRSFHENKPFDEFTREQLAGDLLPDATREQKVASAFNRLNRMTAEGGAQDKEYLAKYAADRVRTLGMAWLGLTTGCAECHDHKFDPLTTKDFYRLEAFFADIEEKGFYGGANATGGWGTSLSLPTPDQQAELDRLDAELAAVRKESAALTDDDLAKSRSEWEKRTLELDEAKQLAWKTLEPTNLATEQGATLSHTGGGLIEASGANPDNETYIVTVKPGEGRWTSLLVRPERSGDLPGNGIARGWVNFMLTEVEAELSGGGGSGEAGEEERPATDAAFHSPDRPLPFSVAISNDLGDADPFPAASVIDGDPKTGWGSEFGRGGQIVLRFDEPLETTNETVLTVRLRHDSDIRRATIGRFRLLLSRVEGATADGNGLPKSVLDALRQPAADRSEKEQSSIAAHFRTTAPELEELRNKEARLFGERARLAGSIPTVLVTQARKEPRPIRVLPRGNWMDDSGEIVEPNVPEFLGLLASDDGRLTRLDLANWIVSDENPLTARVFVNRLWEQFFGVGLSKVLEDVGSQGQAPSHPQLLDWLAAEFMQPNYEAAGTHAWDVKHISRTIVTSHAYRQSSFPDPELVERDPENRLVARQIPLRIEAESVRDNALAVSGLLEERFGGPSVFPVQPDGYWAALNFPRREYSASRDDDLYRRSVYTHWQRMFLHPSLLVFDAPTREECLVNRTQSNTPLQALVLLNDPIFVEAARTFAAQAIKQGGSTADDRIAWAFRRATGRPPQAAEHKILAELHARELAKFEQAPEAAQSLIAVGEANGGSNQGAVDLAAMTTVTRAILNLHETITRD